MNIRHLIVFLLSISTDGILHAQSTSHEVVKSDFEDNWFVQVGPDMSLQNPYGYDFLEVFPNGKSFGVNVAVGKWFSPEIALRAKVNWENGISLFENNHADWLAPFHDVGTNMRRGGYISAVGDIPLDIHNILYGYDSDRRWNMQVFPRAGFVYNFGVEKGSPLIGVGIGNTYKLSDKVGVYADVAYQFVSSGFVGVVKNTGTGTGSNGYFDISVGAQMNLGTHGFHRPSKEVCEDAVICSSFWKGWFLQTGIDMNLLNPYKYNFGEVFPKGKTFGLNAAVGKWFTPELGIRARLNWENGIRLFENRHLEWLAPAGANGINMDKGGCVFGYMDVMLNASEILGGHDADRRVDVLVFGRAGLGSNIAISSGSPVVGGGVGATYRLSPQWSIYTDAAYQGITSEFFGDVAVTGMTVSAGSNGMLNFHIGLQYDL